MRDEETGSWWQQVTGEAIHGPLKGQKLRPVLHDELTFAVWKSEQPNGRVLRPEEAIVKSGEYAPADWEAGMQKVRVTTAQLLDASLKPRTLVIGVTVNGASKAYPFEALTKQSPIIDDVGGTPIVLVLGPDKKSVRAFERTMDGRKLELYAKQPSTELRLIDPSTGSEFDFTGKAVSGQLTGRALQKLPVLNDYWFDWQTYNPKTTIYELGVR